MYLQMREYCCYVDFYPENWIREWVSALFECRKPNQAKPKYAVEMRKHRHPFNLIVQFYSSSSFSSFSLCYMNRIISQLIQTFMMIMATKLDAHKKHHRCAASQLIKTIRTLAAGIYFLCIIYYDACLIVAAAACIFYFLCIFIRSVLFSVSLYVFISFRLRALVLLECTDYYPFCVVVAANALLLKNLLKYFKFTRNTLSGYTCDLINFFFLSSF